MYCSVFLIVSCVSSVSCVWRVCTQFIDFFVSSLTVCQELPKTINAGEEFAYMFQSEIVCTYDLPMINFSVFPAYQQTPCQALRKGYIFLMIYGMKRLHVLVWKSALFKSLVLINNCLSRQGCYSDLSNSNKRIARNYQTWV